MTDFIYSAGYFFGRHLHYYQDAKHVFGPVADFYCDYIHDSLLRMPMSMPIFRAGYKDGCYAAFDL